MRPLILSVILLLSGSVWGQGKVLHVDEIHEIKYIAIPKICIAYTNNDTLFVESLSDKALSLESISDLIRAEIERWWDEKTPVLSAVKKPEPDTIVIDTNCYELVQGVGVDGVTPVLLRQRCQPEPLRMVIDTVGVDTVDWIAHKVSFWDTVTYYSPDWVRYRNWRFEPVIKVVVDTTYDLTESQVNLLKKGK